MEDLTMVRGVIFDMDGLMFDSESVWATLWAPCCAQLGIAPPTEEFISHARGLSGENMLRHMRQYYPDTDPQLFLDTLWAMGRKAFAESVPVKPGLRELLRYLKQQNIPCIVASSSPEALIRNNLRTTGTSDYFMGVVCGCDVQRSKPDPDIFLLAAQRLGLPAEDCLVLEDSFNGVRAGHASGAVTVMVPDIDQPTEEIRQLYRCCCKDLLEVKQLLEAGRL